MVVANATVSWGHNESTQPDPAKAAEKALKPKKKSKKQRERAAAKEHEQNFPPLNGSGVSPTGADENQQPTPIKGDDKFRTMGKGKIKQGPPVPVAEQVDTFAVKPVSEDAREEECDTNTATKSKSKVSV